jgi:S-adenosylmethionine:tRNA ribosyltransferase-isomerase
MLSRYCAAIIPESSARGSSERSLFQLKSALFQYHLPPDRIAQRPLPNRDDSRMLVLDRLTGRVRHSFVRDLPRYLAFGDRLVVNASKVIQARLMARKNVPFSDETGALIEIFLLKELTRKGPIWESLLCPGKRIKGDVILHLQNGRTARVIADRGDGHFHVDFSGSGGFGRFVESYGRVPLPPYIRRTAEQADQVRYQTIFAKKRGSVAAPTAGLHFTPRLLQALEGKGIRRSQVTLHVGLGTFQQVSSEEIEDHRMHEEAFEVSSGVVKNVLATRKRGGRVVAIGTTSLRALESAARGGRLEPGTGTTDLFITPGYCFQTVDALFTNFHQPGSSLIMLVSAFAGRENILRAYRVAIRKKYRFLSYGDAMLIL